MDESVAEHVALYHEGSVSVEEIDGKGRVLIAARDFEEGDRVLLEYPLVQVAVDRGHPAFQVLLDLQSKDALEFGALFYWCALCSLTAADVAGARCASWPTVPAVTQRHVLQLHAPDEACLVPSASVERLVTELWGDEQLALRVEQLLQRWIFNSFDLSTTEDARDAGALYLSAAMLSHSCAPNAAWHLDESNTYILHAREFIGEGDEICISYLSPGDLCLPTDERRSLLAATKDFRCTCARCTASLDSARAFRCLCSGVALAEADAGDSDTVVCPTCGTLPASSSLPLLQAESEFVAVARKIKQDATCGEERSGKQTLAHASDRGLADAHWVMDLFRAAAIAEASSKDRIELLRAQIAELLAAGSYTSTRVARLRVELGDALSSADSWEEASAAYSAAAETLGILFGDDHPEHRSAVTQCERATRQLSVARAPKVVMASSAAELGNVSGAGVGLHHRAGGKRTMTKKR